MSTERSFLCTEQINYIKTARAHWLALQAPPGNWPSARDIQGNLTHGLTRGAVQLRVRPILVWLRARFFLLLLFVVKLTCASLMETRQQGEWVPFLTSQTGITESAALLFVSSWSDNELNLSVARATVMTSLWEWRRGKKKCIKRSICCCLCQLHLLLHGAFSVKTVCWGCCVFKKQCNS